MNFSIHTSTEFGLNLHHLTDNGNKSVVTIDASNGARMHGFMVKGFIIIDSIRSEEELKDFPLSYKSAKMSPFACRIENGRYLFNGKEYEFSNKFPDGSAIHGILFNRAFTLENSFITESMANVQFSYDYPGDEPGYPFKYRCEVSYTLEKDNRLSISTTIINNESFAIPMQDGWHPYFTLGGSIDDCTLQIATSKKLVFTDKLIPNGDFINDARFLTPHPLKGIELDNSFLLEDYNANEPVCILSNASGTRRLEIYAENYPIVQVYTPPHRQSIALENISGAPNCFNNLMGLKMVEDKVEFECLLVGS
jgi:aldose 1-epimerase